MEKNTRKTLKGGLIKNMGFEPKAPIYAGDGVKIWNAVDKNQKPYLKVKVLNGSVINCFQVEIKKRG
jgi:hypothetical protein